MLCSICLNDFPATDFFTFSGCGHAFHRPCLVSWANSKLSGGADLLPTCFEDGCGAAVLTSDLALLASEDIFARGCRLRAQRADPSVRFCPRAGCNAEVRGGSEAASALRCETCATEFCWQHDLAHVGSTCAEYAARADVVAEAAASEQALSASAKRCPSCSAWVERSGGCNVVPCAACSANFCWREEAATRNDLCAP
jgi:hypothetical protein